MTGFVLGVELDGEGYHPAAGHRGYGPSVDARALLRRVRAAENAGFTLATFDDSILPPATSGAGRIDAVNRAAFVAATTSTIGLVPAVETTYAEPFHVSSQLASLDYASRGRAGWIATRITDAAAGITWGRTVPDVDREQRDAIEVVRRLWDSWEDDAAIRDYSTGRFLDRDKLHYIDFAGKSYSVKGPAIVPRPPQGQPVVFGNEADRDQVDVVLTGSSEVRGAAALTFVEIDVALDTAVVAASDRLAELNARIPAPTGTRLHYAGSPTGFVELLTELARHADGVRLFPAVVDEDLPVLARQVLPALFAAGLAHRPVPGSTLRANLGLPRPANRYSKV
jgi:alkanesulfonate monooxygenase SsuD/methylene tetrahydromethanopterin reductase-like flavin-dependent oxidoreductase (luciferase family)